MKSPLISNIQRFSVDDGPGIRTTAFLKGCNLHCRWCHNPECISSSPSLQLLYTSCTSCGRCEKVCPSGVHEITKDGKHLIHREKCTACGKCVTACLSTALALIGENYTPEQLVKELLRDRKYFETSNGGVTLSGGDPMLYPEFTFTVLKLLKQQNINTAVDTAGCVPYSHFEQVMPYADLFLYDIKLYHAPEHREMTGVDNAMILENIRLLSSARKRIFVRTPIIPTCNDDLKELDAIAAFLASLPNKPELIQLLPYHSYGTGKYATLGVPMALPVMTPPSEDFMQTAVQLFLDKGLNATIS